MPHQRRKTPPDLSEGRRGDKARDERRRSENRQRLASAVIYKSTSHDSPFHIVLSDTRIRRQATWKLFDDGMVPLLQAAGQQSSPFWRPRRQVGSRGICAKSVFHPFARRDALLERVLLTHHLRQVVRVRGDVLARVAAGKHHFELARSPLEHAGHGSRNRWGEYYARCRDRGMPHGKALKAVARKRLEVVYAIMGDKVPYAA